MSLISSLHTRDPKMNRMPKPGDIVLVGMVDKPDDRGRDSITPKPAIVVMVYEPDVPESALCAVVFPSRGPHPCQRHDVLRYSATPAEDCWSWPSE
jgi:hypothetical protein